MNFESDFCFFKEKSFFYFNELFYNCCEPNPSESTDSKSNIKIGILFNSFRFHERKPIKTNINSMKSISFFFVLFLKFLYAKLYRIFLIYFDYCQTFFRKKLKRKTKKKAKRYFEMGKNYIKLLLKCTILGISLSKCYF